MVVCGITPIHKLKLDARNILKDQIKNIVNNKSFFGKICSCHDVLKILKTDRPTEIW